MNAFIVIISLSGIFALWVIVGKLQQIHEAINRQTAKLEGFRDYLILRKEELKKFDKN